METREKIGNVILDYSDYTGKDQYSDGAIEDYILTCVQENRKEEILKTNTNWAVLYHLSDMRENLLEAISFPENSNVLEIGSGCGALTGLLAKKAKKVTCVELSKKRSEINAVRNQYFKNIEIKVGNFQKIEKKLKKYDVITLIGVWEYSILYIEHTEPYEEMLRLAQKHLNEGGIILVAIENKMGMKYWNGAVEDHTGKQYSGLNDYFENEKVRTFSKTEIETILKKLHLHDYRFFYPSPDYKIANEVYSDEYLPKVGDIRTFKKNYSDVQFYNFNDAIVNDQICFDGMFPYFSNSFLVMIGKGDEKTLYVKYNRERKEEYRCATKILTENGKKKVIKYPLSELAQSHIKRIYENSKIFLRKEERLYYVSGELEENKFVTDYIDGDNIYDRLFLHRHNIEKFVEETKKIISYCYINENELTQNFVFTESFGRVFGTEYPLHKKSIEYTNIDQIFQNMVFWKDRIAVFDCEWVFDFPIPYEYVIWRTLNMTYEKFRAYFSRKISKCEFIRKFGISEKDHYLYGKMEQKFTNFVSGNNFCEAYLKNYAKLAFMQTVRCWD